MGTATVRKRVCFAVSGAVLASALLGGVLAGCATEVGANGAAATPTPSPAPTSPTPLESVPPSEMPSSSPSDTPPSETSVPPADGQMTLSGTVRPGVEAGCLVLQHEGTLYLLLGAENLKPGDEVTVTGHVDTDGVSYCMQGTPFVVEEVSKP